MKTFNRTKRELLPIARRWKPPTHPSRRTPTRNTSNFVTRLYQLKRELEYVTTRSEQLAGNVALIESNLETTEANSKAASSAGNFEARTVHKVSAQRLKGELADAKEELRKARIYKERAKEALEAFDQHERIAELQKELGL